jgi:hypothetical protein
MAVPRIPAVVLAALAALLCSAALSVVAPGADARVAAAPDSGFGSSAAEAHPAPVKPIWREPAAHAQPVLQRVACQSPSGDSACFAAPGAH